MSSCSWICFASLKQFKKINESRAIKLSTGNINKFVWKVQIKINVDLFHNRTYRRVSMLFSIDLTWVTNLVLINVTIFSRQFCYKGFISWESKGSVCYDVKPPVISLLFSLQNNYTPCVHTVIACNSLDFLAAKTALRSIIFHMSFSNLKCEVMRTEVFEFYSKVF